MSKAVVLVSSDTSYLEHQLSLLNYTSYPIDEYNHKNIHKLYDLRFINDFIKDILLKHSHPYLIYGSGLEDKQKIIGMPAPPVPTPSQLLPLARQQEDGRCRDAAPPLGLAAQHRTRDGADEGRALTHRRARRTLAQARGHRLRRR